MNRRLVYVGVFCLFAVGVHASVTQVDGTIIPVPTSNACDDTTHQLQVCIDGQEIAQGGSAGAVNVVRDADIVPQTFLPDVTSPVTFIDISESAGFENSF